MIIIITPIITLPITIIIAITTTAINIRAVSDSSTGQNVATDQAIYYIDIRKAIAGTMVNQGIIDSSL